jgi:hypothetical protein
MGFVRDLLATHEYEYLSRLGRQEDIQPENPWFSVRHTLLSWEELKMRERMIPTPAEIARRQKNLSEDF